MVNRAGRLVVHLVTVSGRAAAVEFRFGPRLIEVWREERCRAAFDRAMLSRWLADPGPPLTVDGVGLSVDRMVDLDGRIALTLPDVTAWTLSPEELSALTARV